MSGPTLALADMAKYLRLLKTVFPKASGFEVRDTENSLLLCQDSGVDSDPDLDWVDVESDVAYVLARKAGVTFRARVDNQQGESLGCVFVSLADQHAVGSITSIAKTAEKMRLVGDILQRECLLETECTQLALELTERYEELHLVYSTNDQVDLFEEGEQALKELVHNCAEYIDVSMAALILRDRSLVIHHEIDGYSQAEIDELIEVLSGGVYDHVESQIDSLIVNRDEDEVRERVLNGRNENVLAFPVVENNGTVSGVLVTVVKGRTRDFSNSDRNLMEVMARKASRIIQTHHDSLTGLMNRRGFEFILLSKLTAARKKNQQHCALHLNIDQLHVVNDLMGHAAGDEFIRRVAEILKKSLRDSDYVARLDGDEFGVLLTNCSHEHATTIVEKILSAVSSLSMSHQGRHHQITMSAGIVAVNKDSEGIVSILSAAEIACKSAKDAGRNRFETYQDDNTQLVRRSEEVRWMHRLQEALRHDEFMLHCQPVQPLMNTDGREHFEILIRMNDVDGGVLAPGVFMPAAERYQMMPQVDRWVIRESLKTLSASWSAMSDASPVFCINLSGQSLTNNGFLKFVTDEISNSIIPPQNICFEITETSAVANFDEAMVFIDALHAIGCKFALDDFGAGLSSFGYLKKLSVDYLKIDGSFVKDITSDAVSLSMVKVIAQLGQTMNLQTVAEFVQGEEAIAMLREIGVNYVQGYGVRAPVPLYIILDELTSLTRAATA